MTGGRSHRHPTIWPVRNLCLVTVTVSVSVKIGGCSSSFPSLTFSSLFVGAALSRRSSGTCHWPVSCHCPAPVTPLSQQLRPWQRPGCNCCVRGAAASPAVAACAGRLHRATRRLQPTTATQYGRSSCGPTSWRSRLDGLLLVALRPDSGGGSRRICSSRRRRKDQLAAGCRGE